MTVLLKEPGNILKNAGNPLFFLRLTNKHTPFGKVVGNRLILAFFRKKAEAGTKAILSSRTFLTALGGLTM